MHLAELLDELVDFDEGAAAAFGNALAAGAFDDLRALSFLGSHGEDDGFHVFDALVVESSAGELLFDFVEAGHHAEHAFEGAEILNHLHLTEEVFEVELAFGHALGGFLGLLVVDFFGDVLDHADHVTHAEDAVGHAFGVELGEVLELFAFTDVFDGLAGYLAHGEGGATAGVTIKFGKNDAGDADGLVEVLGDRDRLLTSGGVGNEKGLFGLNELVKLLEFLDEKVVDFLATGGVEDDDGGLAGFIGFEGLLGDFDEVFFARLGGEDGDFALGAEHGELLDGGGSVEVAGDEKRFAAIFLETAGELGGGGGFTRTVESAKQDVRGGIEVEGALVSAEEKSEFVVENFDDLFTRLHRLEDVFALRFFTNGFDEVLGDGEFDVGLEQSEPDFAQSIEDVFFGDFGGSSEAAERLVECVGEVGKHDLR